MNPAAVSAHLETQLLDRHGTAAMLGISVWTVDELASAGELPIVQLPNPLGGQRPLRRKLFDRADVLALIARSKSGGPR